MVHILLDLEYNICGYVIMDKPKTKSKTKGSEIEYKYKYFKYMYKIKKLYGKFPEYEEDEETLFSDTSSDSELGSLDDSDCE